MIFAVTERGQTMGTNYYAVRKRPTTDRPIHIGKSSIGWRFLFEEQNDMFNEPPVVWHTYDQLYEWLYKNTVETDNYVILNEYDDEISFYEFIKLIEEKQMEKNPDDFQYAKNINGYRFADSDFL